MKFPGGRAWREIRRAFFPTDADLEADRDARVAEMLAEDEASAREAEAADFRRACADRLRPYIGRLVLVSNFKGVGLEDKAARISEAVLAAANFGAETPIGTSAVLSSGRDNHEPLVETANALTASLGSRIGGRAFSVRPQNESSDLWLLALARAAEDTARQAGLQPEEVGCIAVVSALDMQRQANIHLLPEPGTAFMLTDISEEARFAWETISAPPDRWGAL